MRCHPLDVHVSIAARRALKGTGINGTVCQFKRAPEHRVEGTFDQLLDVDQGNGTTESTSILVPILTNGHQLEYSKRYVRTQADKGIRTLTETYFEYMLYVLYILLAYTVYADTFCTTYGMIELS